LRLRKNSSASAIFTPGMAAHCSGDLDAAPAAAVPPSRNSGFLLPATRRADSDLAIIVSGDDEEGQPPFRIQLDCAIAGEEYENLRAGKLVLDGAGATLGS
jgi:hypothetical protein